LQHYFNSNHFARFLFFVNDHLIPFLQARLKSPLSAVSFSLKSHHLSASHYVSSASPFAKLMASYFPPFSCFPFNSPAPLSFTELCSCVHYCLSCPATCTASVWLEEQQGSWDVLVGRSRAECLLQLCSKKALLYPGGKGHAWLCHLPAAIAKPAACRGSRALRSARSYCSFCALWWRMAHPAQS